MDFQDCFFAVGQNIRQEANNQPFKNGEKTNFQGGLNENFLNFFLAWYDCHV